MKRVHVDRSHAAGPRTAEFTGVSPIPSRVFPGEGETAAQAVQRALTDDMGWAVTAHRLIGPVYKGAAVVGLEYAAQVWVDPTDPDSTYTLRYWV